MKSVRIRSFSGFAFPRIWTEYEEIRSISPYSVRMQENMEQKNSEADTFQAVLVYVRMIFATATAPKLLIKKPLVLAVPNNPPCIDLFVMNSPV